MKTTEKKVQIAEALLAEIYNLVIDLKNGNPVTFAQLDSIENQITQKVDAMERRKLYTQSKQGNTPEEREQARKEYLNSAGVPESFRY